MQTLSAGAAMEETGEKKKSASSFYPHEDEDEDEDMNGNVGDEVERFLGLLRLEKAGRKALPLVPHVRVEERKKPTAGSLRSGLLAKRNSRRRCVSMQRLRSDANASVSFDSILRGRF